MRVLLKGSFASLFGAAALAVGTMIFAPIASAAPVTEVDLGTPNLAFTVPIGQPQTFNNADATAGSIYSNVDNFTGFGVSNGGAVAVAGVLTTNLLGDDTTPIAGGPITRFSWSVSNLNAAPTPARMRVRFYDNDGAGGNPGTLLAAFSFAASALPTGVSTFFTNLAAGQLTVPNHQIWCTEFFDNSGAATTTAAQLNGLGQGTFDPPVIGSSNDLDMLASPPAAVVGNPPGATQRNSPFAGNPVASYGWELVPLPEPGSLLLGGLALLGLARRRRA